MEDARFETEKLAVLREEVKSALVNFLKFPNNSGQRARTYS